MNRVQNVVQEVLNTREQDAKLLQRDPHTLVLFDCDFVCSKSLDLILEQFPTLDITTQSCDQSKSGFIVIFTCDESISFYRSKHIPRIIFNSLAISAMASFIYTHFTMLFSPL